MVGKDYYFSVNFVHLCIYFTGFFSFCLCFIFLEGVFLPFLKEMVLSVCLCIWPFLVVNHCPMDGEDEQNCA